MQFMLAFFVSWQAGSRQRTFPIGLDDLLWYNRVGNEQLSSVCAQELFRVQCFTIKPDVPGNQI
jgi:hypothetical protein